MHTTNHIKAIDNAENLEKNWKRSHYKPKGSVKEIRYRMNSENKGRKICPRSQKPVL